MTVREETYRSMWELISYKYSSSSIFDICKYFHLCAEKSACRLDQEPNSGALWLPVHRHTQRPPFATRVTAVCVLKTALRVYSKTYIGAPSFVPHF
jgi:hypothetical protein